MPKYYTLQNLPKDEPFINEVAGLTVPNKNMTVRQIFSRFANGSPLPSMVHTDAGYDPVDMPDDYIPQDRQSDFEFEDIDMSSDSVPVYRVSKLRKKKQTEAADSSKTDKGNASQSDENNGKDSD